MILDIVRLLESGNRDVKNVFGINKPPSINILLEGIGEIKLHIFDSMSQCHDNDYRLFCIDIKTNIKYTLKIENYKENMSWNQVNPADMAIYRTIDVEFTPEWELIEERKELKN